MNIEKVIVNTSRVALTAENLQKMFNDIDFYCKVSKRKDEALVVEVEDADRDVIDLVTDKLNEIDVEGFVEEYEEEDANNDTLTNWRAGRLTYRVLLDNLQRMSPAQLDSDATLFDEENDEYIEIKGIGFADKENGVLDEGHPFFVLAKEL